MAGTCDQSSTPLAAYAACRADPPASTSTAARDDGGIRLPAASPHAKSSASVSEIASSQPRAGTPRRIAMSAPSPIVRSRAPIACVSSLTAGLSASRPIHTRPVSPGIFMNAMPNAMRAPATFSAIRLGFTRGNVLRARGTRPSGGRYRARRRLLEHELALARVHSHRVAGREAALQQRQRQLVHELLLDHALQRARTVGGVVAEVADQRPGVVGQLDLDAAVADPLDQPSHLELH